uniref:Uncharacterized protein n=1 Tax=Attheya septentrionalis TaxID=420275 RepID=A0A7S2UB49_9STRA|mmetsp:Transcript_15152/g.27439  ORF Transcript_15152/g.27439 Transcript_15152/m.27439 type:complete len:375 (+) Transcript_15152:183-1307(+)|eukprot:CAMPEP_0198285412 /NCGR_PEP_ID=MMETSP1449-20131203/4704_1 /TAXON_ID=420275 /ORGANISM="Attheya septentrionalis, Strain CCMP2084" /LENGTH=374 /DNA_ID=CAMNT_0043982819 /DNA_START=180 /DNA_END=1304 /DNA_ORIENTATION=+
MSTSTHEDMKKSELPGELGKERLKADQRQFGGLIFALGILATFGSLINIANEVGPNGTTSKSGVPLSNLIAGCAQAFFGTIAMFTGYLSLVYDWGHKSLTLALIIATQLAWLPYLTALSGIAKGARNDSFIPSAYDPSEADINFVAAMGMLGIIAHGAAYIGSLAFMEFALYAYQSGKTNDRNSSYYLGRSGLYNFLVVLAGFSQLALGSFVLHSIGNGPLTEGPVNVGVYTIYFPEISVFVGLVQILVGFFGLARRMGKLVGGKDDHSFQIACGIMWICMLVLELMVQVAYAPGPMMGGAAPTRACIIFGLAFMPAYLDAKTRTTPAELPPSYYSMEDTSSDMDKNDDEKIQNFQDEDKEETASQVEIKEIDM